NNVNADPATRRHQHSTHSNSWSPSSKQRWKQCKVHTGRYISRLNRFLRVVMAKAKVKEKVSGRELAEHPQRLGTGIRSGCTWGMAEKHRFKILLDNNEHVAHDLVGESWFATEAVEEEFRTRILSKL